MRGLRPLLRLAVRDARRDRWRSLLVLVIVVLPVAGLVAAVTLTDSGSPTTEENAVAGLGRADLILFAAPPELGGPADDAALLDALGPLPEGAEVEIQRLQPGAMAADGVRVPLEVEDGSLAPDALAAGRRELVDGTAPSSPDAVALSTSLLELTGAAIGDEVAIEPLGEVTVVGTFRAPEHLSRRAALVAPGTLEGAPAASPGLLLDLPEGATPSDLGNAAVDGVWDDPSVEPTFFGQSREELMTERFSRGERWLFIIVGGLAAVEVALVAGAAFAVSVRRRQRELGLLAATGGTVVHVRRSVMLTGVTVGVLGSLIGVVLGILGSWAALPLIGGVVDRVVSGLRLDPSWIAGAGSLGVLAASLGAWWPARNVAKLPVLTALSGRRPTPAPARTGLVKGLVLVVAGVGLCLVGSASLGGNPFVFLAGSVAVVLGAGLTSPWLLEQLGRTARFLPAGPRLAVRDAARFRTRNGPIVTAAMAGLAASVTIGAVVVSIDARERAEYVPSLPDDVLVVMDGGTVGSADLVASAVGAQAWPITHPDAEVAVTTRDGTPISDDRVVNAASFETELVRRLVGEQAVADLADGRAVALKSDTVTTVAVRPYGTDGRPGEPVAVLDVVPHVLGEGAEGWWAIPDVLLPPVPEVMATVTPNPGDWNEHLIVLDGPLDAATDATAVRTAAEIGEDVTVSAERGYRTGYGRIEEVATIVGGIAGLLIVAVAVALAAAESRSDLRTLIAVGAGRRTRRSLAAGRALLLAGLGGLLAVPVGLLPAAALLSTLEGSPPLVLPWRAIVVVAVLVPLLATLGAIVASRREPSGFARAA